MKRNLKVLGIALAAAFAMSAVAASAAPAQDVHHFLAKNGGGEDGITHLTADALDTDGEPSPQVFKKTAAGDEEVICNEVDVNGTIEGEEVTKVTVEPIYDDCHATRPGLNVGATVNTNGCHYEFTGETNASEHGEVTIQCPEGEQIELKVTVFQLKCVDIEADQEVTGVRYIEEEEEGGVTDIHLEATVHNIKSVSTPGLAGCGEGTHDTGTYEGEVTVTGFDDEGHTEREDLGLNTTTE